MLLYTYLIHIVNNNISLLYYLKFDFILLEKCEVKKKKNKPSIKCSFKKINIKYSNKKMFTIHVDVPSC